ncbi:MAG TPA: UDP-glucose 4-epimerase GalE [Verrucomicrobiales bacterium]|nr:UDP-glucose 4-epimerase GalE [Verrucomicrobiales bacterium]
MSSAQSVASFKAGCVLVTGGAGYIGSHTVKQLKAVGIHVVVLDNLVHGHRQAVLSLNVPLVEGDLGDETLLASLFSSHPIDTVIHFAAYAYVGESVDEPLRYYRNNTAAPLVLLDAMRRHECRAFIFSSTCATYGDPVALPITEEHPQNPINPYGRSKLMLEQILRDCEPAWGLRSVCLRYFNACGCSIDGSLGEDHDPETHLIPRVLMAARGEIEAVTVFGTDYPTPDGTCIRDYIHVEDLARAHILALDYLTRGGASTACNLGAGSGVSVRSILEIAENVTGRPVPVRYGPRRPGDPPELVADPSRARELLGWQAEHPGVSSAVESAWRWMTGPRQGRYRA